MTSRTCSATNAAIPGSDRRSSRSVSPMALLEAGTKAVLGASAGANHVTCVLSDSGPTNVPSSVASSPVGRGVASPGKAPRNPLLLPLHYRATPVQSPLLRTCAYSRPQRQLRPSESESVWRRPLGPSRRRSHRPPGPPQPGQQGRSVARHEVPLYSQALPRQQWPLGVENQAGR